MPSIAGENEHSSLIDKKKLGRFKIGFNRGLEYYRLNGKFAKILILQQSSSNLGSCGLSLKENFNHVVQ